MTAILLTTAPERPAGFVGPEEGDDFGAGLAVLGDVDGDGTDDFAVSDPWRESADRDVGWIALVSGKSRAVLWQVRGAPAPEGEDPRELGTALFPLGDVDGDEVPDLAEWTWWSEPLTILSGASGAAVLEVSGRTVAPAGDVDGDGRCDLLVGPSQVSADDAEGTTTLGWVRSGADGEILRTLSVPSPVTSSGAVRAVALHDLDGPGLGGSGKPDWGLRAGGRLHVFRAEDGSPLSTVSEPGSRLLAVARSTSSEAGPLATIEEAERGIRLVLRPTAAAGADGERAPIRRAWLRRPSDLAVPWGLALENLGDVDADGVEDFLVGVDPGSLVEGVAVAVWSGAGRGVLWRYPEPSEICRTRSVSIGDLDGDGTRDVLVSGSWSTGGPPVTGWVEALSGRTGARLFRLTRADLEP